MWGTHVCTHVTVSLSRGFTFSRKCHRRSDNESLGVRQQRQLGRNRLPFSVRATLDGIAVAPVVVAVVVVVVVAVAVAVAVVVAVVRVQFKLMSRGRRERLRREARPGRR